MFSKIITKLKNKYNITLLLFLLWILIFDQNNLIDRIRDLNKLTDLKQEKYYYKNLISENKLKINNLTINKNYLEKFAREKYIMKNDDEDIFIIVEK